MTNARHPSGISAYLRAELDRRGITHEAFAEAIGIQKSSLSNILNTPGIVPKLQTLSSIADELDMPLATLIEICGFTVGKPRKVNNKEQLALMLETVPELRGLVDHLLPLPQEHLQAIAQYVDYYMQNLDRRQRD